MERGRGHGEDQICRPQSGHTCRGGHSHQREERSALPTSEDDEWSLPRGPEASRLLNKRACLLADGCGSSAFHSAVDGTGAGREADN